MMCVFGRRLSRSYGVLFSGSLIVGVTLTLLTRVTACRLIRLQSWTLVMWFLLVLTWMGYLDR